MNIHLDLYTLSLGVAVVILLFTSSLLFAVRENRNHRADAVFCWFLLLLAAALLNDVLGENEVFVPFPVLYDYQGLCILCLGPLLYFYILYQTKPHFEWRPWQLGHFIVLVPYALLAWWFWKDDGLAKLQAFRFQRYQDFQYGLLLEYLPMVQIAGYLLVCFYHLRQHNRNIRELMSSVEHATLAWLRSLLLTVIALFGAWMLANLVREVPDSLLGLAAVLVSYALCYQALGQKAIYDTPQPAQVFEMVETELAVRYSSSTLTTPDIQALMQQVETCMRETKPYLVNGLTLTQLAERLDVTPHQLSQVLNQGFKENFYKFINRYRVEESKRLLLDSRLQHYNILGIAFEAGFNSKSTFNKVFKEVTGLSPSEFQQENKPA